MYTLKNHRNNYHLFNLQVKTESSFHLKKYQHLKNKLLATKES